MPTVAIGDQFLEAFARIPRAQQRKVREFIDKFKADPTSAAINYEKIHAVKDDKVRTVRIDLKYRAVILHPEKGDVHVLVWVDNHDEAMDWARARSFDVHPHTGALQVVEIAAAATTGAAGSTNSQVDDERVFAAFPDDLLVSLGLPSILLPAVRAIRTAAELTTLGPHLPAEATEALVWLAEGIPADEVREAVQKPASRSVDPNDLAMALEHPDSKRRFVAIRHDVDLAAILDAPLAKWRVFLHPSQEKLVRKRFNGPARVLGGAGTGKTVVAMHRARHLAAAFCSEPADRILLTTFTANLAANVEELLQGWCPSDAARIDVVHLHAWAVRFLRERQVQVEIAEQETIERCWEAAAAGTTDGPEAGFLKAEWEYVVRMHGITSRDEYLRVPRTGRGRTLSRQQRARVWEAFDRFRTSLGAFGQCEWTDVIRSARVKLEEAPERRPYRAVVVDEAQDFHPEEWKLLRSMVQPGPDDLFLVGDSQQRIYGRKTVLKDCGVNVLGRSSYLKINYRTTEQIRSWAAGLLAGKPTDDLDGGLAETKGYRSLLSGPPPLYQHFSSAAEELDFVVARVRDLLEQRPAEEVCLVARTAKLVKDEYRTALKSAGIPHVVLGQGKDSGGEGVRLATMHRVKGLEFPVVLVAGVNAKVVPMRTSANVEDSMASTEHEAKERSLLFVAATRARETLVVTSWGTPSPFLQRTPPTA